ncbi:MAG: 6-phosphogluconolactonase [Desulfofustis sp.]|nr:6-phosphogluconolactonase [Desulfofustis sp.]
MIIKGNRRELEIRAASLLVSSFNETLSRKQQVCFGVVGGRSVGTILDLLRYESVDWERVHLFMIDERLVGIDHPDSNYRLVYSHVAPYMVPANLHPFVFRPGEEQAALAEYRQELEKVGGHLDVLLLSSGEDGHIASLFPEHETVDSQDDFFFVTASAPKPPPERMSASPKLLSRASTAVLLFLGGNKQQSFNNFIDDSMPLRKCPAKIARTIDSHFILTDSNGGVRET